MIQSKLPQVGTTIFSEMSALANKHGALNLSQGFPDFSIDAKLSDLYYKFSTEGHNQYAPMPGVLRLRENIANHISKNYKTTINPESEITITAGATQAIFTAISAIINKNDEAILFTPSYDCYAPSIKLYGGKPIYIPLQKGDYSIDWDLVFKKTNSKTKLIIINSPHNPTGTVISKKDIQKLEELLIKNPNLLVISDEVYEHIVFDKILHESSLTSEVIRNRAFITYSFGKSLHITGWKLGYCIAPKTLTKEFRKVHQFNVFSCNTPAQLTIAEYLKNDVFADISSMYEHKRNLFIESIKESRFTINPSKGTYFQLLNYSNITEMNDVEFAKKLTIENRIASIPISVFYDDLTDNKVLRFCFAKQDETIKKAGEILCKI